MEASCLRCHGALDQAPSELVTVYGPERRFGRQAAEVVSAISIRVPLSEAYVDANRFSWQLSGVLLALLAALFGAQFWPHRHLLYAPPVRVRDKARQISSGGEHPGEQIPLPFGNELRELIAAFNTMPAGLHDHRDQLKTRVEERAGRLQAANEQLEHEITERGRAEQAVKQYSERLEGVGVG